MGEAAKRMATYADLEALPPNVVGEIIGGELHTMPRPAPRHAVACTNLSTWSNARFGLGDGGPGGWWIIVEPELHLGPDVLVPSTQGHDRATKMTRYAMHGVPHVWLLDPAARLLEVFQLEGSVWMRAAAHEEDDVVRAVPFQDVELRLGLLWPSPSI